MNCPDCKVKMKLTDEGGVQKKISVYQCGKCKTEFHQFGNVLARYRESEQDFVCNECGSEILTTTVAHTVRDGLFAFSGSGRVQNETVPYCPHCEKEPEFHGKAISEDGKSTV